MGKQPRRRVHNKVSVDRAASGADWVLVHPRCVRERSEDLAEVRDMIAAGEADIAIDELRWLLADCSEMIEAHFLLGKLAVEADADAQLARGHFGFGFQLGLTALRRKKFPKPLPALHPANRAFYDSGRGLVWTLHQLEKTPMAIEVAEQLRSFDPKDPFGLGSWIDEMRSGGQQVVDLSQLF